VTIIGQFVGAGNWKPRKTKAAFWRLGGRGWPVGPPGGRAGAISIVAGRIYGMLWTTLNLKLFPDAMPDNNFGLAEPDTAKRVSGDKIEARDGRSPAPGSAGGRVSRRSFLARGSLGLAAAAISATVGSRSGAGEASGSLAQKRGSQRLSLEKLRAWEKLGYGMFIHYGMSTFVGNELPDGKAPAATYAPDKLDVGQWVSVARDAGMKYAILTTKHVAGHCLWPTKRTDYSVANSADKTDVVEKFVKSCGDKGVLPGFYYCSWDNHNRFGSRTPSDPAGWGEMFTTSRYQTFQTDQITELLTQYGPIAETWIDIPGILGRGYRTFLYEHVAALQPETVVMMNSGISTQDTYDAGYAWPSDLIAIERSLPGGAGFKKWRQIEGKEYYMPGEVCDPIGKDWFWMEGDLPRPVESLAKQFANCRARGVNLLLDVPPDRHGLIPDYIVKALNRLRSAAGI
jgi:alpha-L-fucosidase